MTSLLFILPWFFSKYFCCFNFPFPWYFQAFLMLTISLLILYRIFIFIACLFLDRTKERMVTAICKWWERDLAIIRAWNVLDDWRHNQAKVIILFLSLFIQLNACLFRKENCADIFFSTCYKLTSFFSWLIVQNFHVHLQCRFLLFTIGEKLHPHFIWPYFLGIFVCFYCFESCFLNAFHKSMV